LRRLFIQRRTLLPKAQNITAPPMSLRATVTAGIPDIGAATVEERSRPPAAATNLQYPNVQGHTT